MVGHATRSNGTDLNQNLERLQENRSFCIKSEGHMFIEDSIWTSHTATIKVCPSGHK